MSPQKSTQGSQGTEPLEKQRSRSQSQTEGSQSKRGLRVKSLLIEPRENEPPRVSVSVEYSTDKAPDVKALQKAAMGAVHDVVRREGKLEDLGYREQQRSRLLTQTFEAREKESA